MAKVELKQSTVPLSGWRYWYSEGLWVGHAEQTVANLLGMQKTPWEARWTNFFGGLVTMQFKTRAELYSHFEKQGYQLVFKKPKVRP